MWLSQAQLCFKQLNVLVKVKKDRIVTIASGSFVKFSQYAREPEPREDNSFKDKILYNTYVTPHHYLELFRRKREADRNSRKVTSNQPISLRFLSEEDNIVSTHQQVSSSLPDGNKAKKLDLPYRYSVDYEVRPTQDVEKKEIVMNTGVSVSSMLDDESIKGTRNWMNDYEKYCGAEENNTNDSTWLINYGTADPDVPSSDVACGGCGAYLHCREPSLPGYLPSEIFLECTKTDLLSILCQRCHFLENYNTALSVQVNPDNYSELISRVKPGALVLLLVDMTDTASSVWPGIMDLLGKKRPIFLVGNKVDLLWGDSRKWLTHVEKILRNCVPQDTKILESCLISAKTGYGVEELVTKLHSHWKGTNDVYIVGCTNVGKSTLFNALIQSDYCKTKAVDLVQRATTAPWPGTTLNLLKFPILRPSAWRLAVRNKRLSLEQSRIKAEKALRKIQIQAEKKKLVTPPQLIGNISHTLKLFEKELDENEDMFSLNKNNKGDGNEENRVSLVNSSDPSFQGRWCFDTPGVLHRDQILDLLTGEELLLTIPRELIVPRTFLLYQGMSLFIACLARLDFVKGEKGVRVTVFSSNNLPITVCKQEDSNEIYEKLLGSDLSVVPQGSHERLSEWPGLSATEPITLCGVEETESCADITFSTTGWISITPEKKEICKFLAWSPLGRGISVRHPPLLPFAVKLRGKKIPRSPAYLRSRAFEYTY